MLGPRQAGQNFIFPGGTYQVSEDGVLEVKTEGDAQACIVVGYQEMIPAEIKEVKVKRKAAKKAAKSVLEDDEEEEEEEEELSPPPPPPDPDSLGPKGPPDEIEVETKTIDKMGSDELIIFGSALVPPIELDRAKSDEDLCKDIILHATKNDIDISGWLSKEDAGDGKSSRWLRGGKK